MLTHASKYLVYINCTSSKLILITKMETKPNVTIVVVGPKSSGKSTLCGQLLYKLGLVSEAEMKISKDFCYSIGDDDGKFAMILDNTEDERFRGTIHISLRRIEAQDRITTLVDLPGDERCFKKLIRGKSYGLMFDSTCVWWLSSPI